MEWAMDNDNILLKINLLHFEMGSKGQGNK